MVLVYLRITPLREHTEYLGRHTRLALQTLTTPTRQERLFVDLRRAIQKPKAREARKNSCILEYTVRLV